MRKWRVAALLLVAALASDGGKFNSAQPPAACPDEITSKGRYLNHSYGFSVTIPRGFEGWWNSGRCTSQGDEGCVCMSDHGRIIPLGKRTSGADRQVEAYADYGVDSENYSVSEAVHSELLAIRESGLTGTARTVSRKVIRLGGLHAQRVAVRYRDKRTKEWMVEDFVEAIRKNVRYLLYLRTPEKQYAGDRNVFDKVVNSFAVVDEDE